MQITVQIEHFSPSFEIEVNENATDEEISDKVREKAYQIFEENMNFYWEKVEEEEPLTDENRPELTIRERNR